MEGWVAMNGRKRNQETGREARLNLHRSDHLSRITPKVATRDPKTPKPTSQTAQSDQARLHPAMLTIKTAELIICLSWESQFLHSPQHLVIFMRNKENHSGTNYCQRVEKEKQRTGHLKAFQRKRLSSQRRNRKSNN